MLKDMWNAFGSNVGQMYNPNFGSLDPAAQQAASNQGLATLGMNMLANPQVRPMQAFGQSLQGLQRQGLQNMQGQFMADQMAEQKDERERRRRTNEGLQQFLTNPKFLETMPERYRETFVTMAGNDPATAYKLWQDVRSNPQGRMMTDQEKSAAGLDVNQPFWVGLEGKPEPIGKDGQTINVMTGDQSTLESELVKELGTQEGKAWAGISSQGMKAGSMQRDMELLDELIKVAPQGPIQGRLAERFPGFSSAGAAFESVVKRLAPQQRAEGSGSTSDIEYEGMLKALPALRNNPEANALISASVKRKAQIDQAMSAEVNKYKSRQQDYTTTVQNLQRLSQMSIMTPELQSLIRGVGPQGGGDDILNQADAIVGG